MNTKPSTLKLRAQSIRTLTQSELRVVNGGHCSGSRGCTGSQPPTTTQ